jgi:hypothetical protein
MKDQSLPHVDVRFGKSMFPRCQGLGHPYATQPSDNVESSKYDPFSHPAANTTFRSELVVIFGKSCRESPHEDQPGVKVPLGQ